MITKVKSPSKRIEYEKMPEPKMGVYLTQWGRFKVVGRTNTGKWIVDEGIVKKHPYLRLSATIVKEMTGNYYINKELYNCEYLGGLCESVENQNDSDENNAPNLQHRGSDEGRSSGDNQLLFRGNESSIS
jgi:hypothetical protein